jgi:hypothetical protein
MISASLQQTFLGTVGRAAVALLVLVAVGCKSGSSWTAKPSWWSPGNDDPAKLASAPPAPTDVAKPSSTAKPYPTTSTPEGYVLENAQRDPTAPALAASPVETSPAAPAQAVTYGTKPAAPPAYDSAPPAAGPSPAQPSALSSITPQVGPYGTPPVAPPAGDQPLPTPTASYAASPPMEPAMAAVPAAAAVDSRFGAARVADARGSDSWSQPPAAVPGATDSRYSASGGSRFASPVPGSEPPTAMPFPPPPASTPTTLPAPVAMPAPPAAGQLPAAAATPASFPTAAPVAPPAAAPAVPTRRPDPGYRPGGTSTYRHSRTILAGGEDAAPGSVTPVAFEAPASP